MQTSHSRRWIAGTLGGSGLAGIGVVIALGITNPAPDLTADGGFASDARRSQPDAAYLEGRYWWNRGDAESLKRALAFFQEALDLDPSMAPAYSARADTYVRLGFGGYLAPDDAFPKAKAAAITALQLDSTLAEPHTAMGDYYLYYEWNWAAADAAFRRTGRTARARFDEAEARAERVLRAHPTSTAIASAAGWIALVYAGLGNRDRALEWLNRALGGRGPSPAWLHQDRRTDGLRDDPRYVRLVRGAGLLP